MKYDSNTPRTEVTIDSENFTVPQPFADGHVCTAHEASALNQLLVENSRNNFAARIKRAKEKGTDIPTQADLDAYISEYEFGERRATSGDPVQREAIELARPHVLNAIKKAGGNLKDYKASEITTKAAELVAKNPQLLEQAKGIVAQKAAIGSAELQF